MRARSAFDVIGVLDALYALEQPTDDWVLGVLTASQRYLSQGRGAGLARYDIGGGDTLRAASLVGLGVPDGWHAVGQEQHRDPALAHAIGRTYTAVVSAGADEMLRGLELHKPYMASMRSNGVGDQWVINGLPTEGAGAALYLFAKAQCRFSPEQRRLLKALSFHVGTADRLHRRLARDGISGSVEAIVGPEARIEHATTALSSRASRKMLVEAVKLRSWARGRAARGEAPRTRMRAFNAPPNATWTLVDWLDRDGKRYVLACRNLAIEAGLASLSARERELALLAKSGRSNKEIAYELGLAHSTVRVLLARAAVKLGVGSRAELVDVFKRLP